MNTNTHSVRRRIAAAAVAAIVLPVFAACGADIDPPTQTINRGSPDKTTTVPEHRSGNRLDFGDEYGKRDAKKNTGAPAAERSLNRLNFRDNGL